MWNVRIAAYCLMPNHYHILVQTPDANISRAMRHINGVYTQRFNRRHGSDGQLFRGRYKSLLVGADSYLLQLVRYIHRNPVNAGLAKTVDDYVWSSHKGYLADVKKWDWLHKKAIFLMLSENRKQWLKRYRQLISIENKEDLSSIIDGKKWPAMLGPKEFTDWIKGQYFALKDDQEIPQAKELKPSLNVIINGVCRFYDVKRETLYSSRRGEFNEPRNVAIYLIRKIRRDSLKEITVRFKMEKYSSISSIIERMKILIGKDRAVRNRVTKLHGMLIKSQEQT